MAERFVALLIGHNSFSLVFVGDLIIAASNKKVSIWEPT